MPNMSYCRFENTTNDFRDCLEHLREKETLKELSSTERSYAKELYQLAEEYREIFEDIERWDESREEDFEGDEDEGGEYD